LISTAAVIFDFSRNFVTVPNISVSLLSVSSYTVDTSVLAKRLETEFILLVLQVGDENII
jgi:hypothetical protein